jgi:hypothetical protein
MARLKIPMQLSECGLFLPVPNLTLVDLWNLINPMED